jgi:putative ABC transport system substrate-binding protein
MRRREFIAGICGAAAVPFAARAQQPNRPLVAVLSPVSATVFARNINALRAGFRDLDYVEGRNLSIGIRYAAGSVAQLPSLAAELVGLKPDAIVVGSVPAITATHSVTRTIPVVMSATTVDPTTMGLAASLAKPGGNVTGFWMEGEAALIAKRLELLKDMVPAIARVGLVINPIDPTDKAAIEQLPTITRALNLDVRVLEIDSPGQFEPVLITAARDGLSALCISHAPLFNENREQITALVTRLRLPAVYGFREFATAGGLLSYASNLPDIWRRSAGVVDKILKGAKPGDLPIERPGRFELLVNLKTAKSLGLVVPDRFLLIADEVIE